ncbi:MAG: choice-of-anchor J domain-containing protein [Paludibacteraceae bacterium]|nr:choice-of-anchor J domain-containing protein [Paludibacteraceae bacterium]
MKKYLLMVISLMTCMLAWSQAILLNEDFNSIQSGVPTGWDNSEGSATTVVQRWGAASDGYTGGCLRFNSKNTASGVTNVLRSIQISLPANDDMELRFMVKNHNGGNLSVYIESDDAQPYTQHLLEAGIATRDWEERVYSLRDYKGHIVRIVWSSVSNMSNDVDPHHYLDDVIIEKAVTCNAPTGVSVSEVNETSAMVVWTNGTGSGDIPTFYEIAVTDEIGNPIVSEDSIVGNYYQISGLSANTVYSLRLRGDCRSNSKDYSKYASYSFRTTCQPMTLPYNNNFDTENGMPSCCYGKGVTINTAPGGAKGGVGRSIRMDYSVDDEAYIVFPSTTEMADNMEIRFDIRAGSMSSVVHYIIAVVTNPIDPASSMIGSAGFDSLTTADWRSVRVNTSQIGDQSTGTYVCLFLDRGAANSVYVDNVMIDVMPRCPRAERLTSTEIGINDVTLDWDMTSGSSYELIAVAAGDTIRRTTSSKPYQFTGLTSNTSYVFAVRANCGTDGWSEWSETYGAKTRCNVRTDIEFIESFESAGGSMPTCWNQGWINKHFQNTLTEAFQTDYSQAHTGAASMKLKVQSSGNVSYLSTECLRIPTAGTYDVTFWMKRSSFMKYCGTEGIEVWVNTIADDTTGGTKLGEVKRYYRSYPEESLAEWVDYRYEISVAGDMYVIFVGKSEGGEDMWIDDVEISASESCRRPENVKAGVATQNSISMAWDAGGSETQWWLTYSITNDTSEVRSDSLLVNSPNYTFTGLTTGCRYNVTGTVNAVCGGNTHGRRKFYALTMYTECDVVIAPYFEDFENHPLDAIPTCWDNSRSTSTPDIDDYMFWGVTDQGGNKVMRMQNSLNHTPGLAIVTSPKITIPAGKPYLLTFDYRTDLRNYYSVDNYQSVFKISNDGGNTFVAFIDTLDLSAPTWVKKAYDISRFAGQTIIMMFESPVSNYGTAAVDNIYIREKPNCEDADITRLTVGDILPNSAKLELDDIEIVDWEVNYGPEGFVAGMGTTVAANGVTQIILNGLTENMKYDVYLRKVCNQASKGGWTPSPLKFKTTCNAYTVPYSEGFESMSEGLLAGCFVTESNGNGRIRVKRGTPYNHTQNGSVGLISSPSEISQDDGYTSSTLGAYTYVYLQRDTNYQISLFAKKYPGVGTENEYEIKFYIGEHYGFEENMTEIGSTRVTNTEWREVKTSFNVETNGYYYIGFASSATQYAGHYYLYADDYRLSKVKCIPPMNVILSNVTADAAEMDWTNNAGRWEVAVDTAWIDGSKAVHGSILHDTVDTPYVSISGMSMNTTYYYSIRTLCSETEISDWRNCESFTTRCAGAGVPFNEGFEDNLVETCWITIDGNGQRSIRAKRSGYNGYETMMSKIVTPTLEIDSIGKYMISGWAYATGDNAGLDCGVMLDPSDMSTYEMVEAYDLPKDEWIEFVAYFDNIPEDAKISKYVIVAVSADQPVYLDDITIDLIPTCAKPSEITCQNILAHDVTVGWTPAPGTNRWIVAAEALDGEGVNMIDTTASNPYTFTGLTQATDYRFKVKTDCGDGDYSYWKESATVTTLCDVVTPPYKETFQTREIGTTPLCWSTTGSSTPSISMNPEDVWSVFSYEGNRMIRMNNKNVKAGEAMIVTPEIQLPAGHNYEFVMDYSHNAACGDFRLKVKRRSENAFTDLRVYQKGNGTNEATPTDWKRVYVDLSAYSGDVVQLALWTLAGGYWGAIFVDNVEVREIRSCKDVAGASVTNILDNGMTVTITDEDASHNAWDWTVVGQGVNVESGTVHNETSKTFNVTGLEASTDYDLYVRANCGGGENSYWTKTQFRTTASAAVFPYVCDFSDSLENTNWQIISSSGAVNMFFIGNDPQTVRTGTKSLYVSDNGGSFRYDILSASSTAAGRILEFESKQYMIEYSWKCEGGEDNPFGGAFDYARAYVVPASTGLTLPTTGMYYARYFPSDIIPIDGGTTIQVQEGWQNTTTLLDMRGRAGRYYVAFVWSNNNKNGEQTPFAVDNVAIREVSCSPVTSLSLKEVTENSATVRYSNNGTPDATEWVVNTINSTVNPIASGTATNDTVLNITGLQRATSYYLFVRNTCGAGGESPWTMLEFASDCGANDVWPFFEDFEQQAFPPVCWSQTMNNGIWRRVTFDSKGMTGYFVELCHVDQNEPSQSAILATPKMHFEADREYELSFLLHHTNRSSYTDDMDIYIGTDTASTDNAIYLGTYTVYNSTVSDELAHTVTVKIPYNTSGDYHILFDGRNATGSLMLDNITVDILPPCLNLQSMVAIDSKNTTSMNVSIDMERKREIQFAWAPEINGIGNVEDTIGSVMSADGTAVITGLTPGTTYLVFARGFCNNGDTTDWTPGMRTSTYATGCFAPDNLHVVGRPSGTKVNLAWGGAENAVKYEYDLYVGANVVRHGFVTGEAMLLDSLTPMTSYTFMLRTICTDTTGWSFVNFATTVKAAEVPYFTGFEDASDNSQWQYANSSGTNNFIAGVASAGHQAGKYGLYISSNRKNYNQDIPSTQSSQMQSDMTNTAFAIRSVYMEPGYYEIGYDWKCDAYTELNANKWRAFGRAFLAPESITLTGDMRSYINKDPMVAQSLHEGNMQKQPTWRHERALVTITEPGNYNIVFEWASFASHDVAKGNLTSIPLAIDNIEVTSVSCLPVTGMEIGYISYDTVAVSLGGTVTGEYALQTVMDESAITQATSFTGDMLSFGHLQAMTQYYLYVRSICESGDTSSWRYVDFYTPDTVAMLPWLCDFENVAENSHWHFSQTGQKNYFITGNQTNNGGSQALYITDNGNSNHYTGTYGAISYAWRDLMLEPGIHEYSYDWKCDGRNGQDFGRVIIIPASTEIIEGMLLNGLDDEKTPKGAIALDGGINLFGSQSWTNGVGFFNVANAGLYKLLVLWNNMALSPHTSSTANQPPLALDNISLKRSTCLPISLSVESTGEKNVTLVVNNVNEGSAVEYRMTRMKNEVLRCDTVYDNRIVLDNLVPSSTYTVEARAICDENDHSLWTSLKVRTSCGVIDSFPYFEGFEYLTSYPRSGSIGNICWNAMNIEVTTLYSTSYPYYSMTSSSSYVHGGELALSMTSSESDDMFMVLPQMDSINDLRMSFWYSNESTSTDCGSITVGYMPNPNDYHSFVALNELPKTTQQANYVQEFTSAVPSARIAFRYGGAMMSSKTSAIDDILVKRMVQGPTFTDSLCYNTPYNLHGFSIGEADLTTGMNHFRRIQDAANSNDPDTIMYADVFVHHEMRQDIFDTICEGQDYEPWQLVKPSTGTYQYTTQLHGCDSTVYLHLTVAHESRNITDTICNGGQYIFNDTVLTDPGMYVRSRLTQRQCLVSDTLYLMVLPDTVMLIDQICEGTVYAFHGRQLTQGGVYFEPIIGKRGCNQIERLELTVIPSNPVLFDTICQGASYLFGNQVLTAPGVYTRQYISPEGCSINETLNLEVSPAIVNYVTDYACEGRRYTGHGIFNMEVTHDTVISMTHKTAEQCDSIEQVTLIYKPIDRQEFNKQIGANESYIWEGETYSTSGTYTVTYTNQFGCDSVLILHLTVGTGVDNASGVEIRILPNPVTAGMTAYVYGDFGEIENVEILNNFGQVVDRFIPSTYPIEVQGIEASGLYYVRINATDGKVYTEKLIVK